MATAFISHATEDKYFVDLLAEILKYHHVDCWIDVEGISIGTKYKDEISNGLAKAENLIVVVSDKTQGSDWVKREITQFHALKPEAKIVPILLNPTSPDAVFDGLKDYQSIYFYNNMLIGFKNLLKFFGKEFLPSLERRKTSERRTEDRRQTDRRKHNVLQRLRYGLWKNYEDSTGLGKFDTYEGSVLSIAGFSRALLPKVRDDEIVSELNRYDFIDKTTGKSVKITPDLLEQYLYSVIEDLNKEFSYITNVYITDRLAEKLVKLYTVVPNDKRKVDRRTNKERRG